MHRKGPKTTRRGISQVSEKSSTLVIGMKKNQDLQPPRDQYKRSKFKTPAKLIILQNPNINALAPSQSREPQKIERIPKRSMNSSI